MISGPPGLLLAVCLLLVLLVPGTEATASTGSGNVGVGMPSEQQQQMLWGGAAAVISSLRSISLALQSLFDRVSAQRLSRGDHSGAERARNIASTLGNGLQWWSGLGSLSWDYVTNYFFSQTASRGMGISEAMNHLSDLSSIVGEVTQLRSDGERLQWISNNYTRVFGVAKTVLRNLLSVFDHDGAMRNCVLAIQREVLEGDLLRDALRLGPTDLDGLVRMVKDVLQRYFAPGRPGQQEDDL